MELKTRLRSVVVDEPSASHGLQVFGLRWETAPTAPDYRTLEEALAEGLLEVTEVSEGGSVPTLKVANKGDRLAFLMAGEQLAGGKQNRVLNASILVPAHGELPIPVSCVERGRWAYRSAAFGSSGTSSHSKLRKMMHAQATMGYRSFGTPTSEQCAIWDEVDRKLAETGSLSSTAMLEQTYQDTRGQLDDMLTALVPGEGVSGAIFAYGGNIVGFDLFDRPSTLRKLWPKLLRAYGIDAYREPSTEGKVVTRRQAEEWLAAGASAAREEVFKSPGVGDDVRLQSSTMTGAGLVAGDAPVHIEAFAESPVA